MATIAAVERDLTRYGLDAAAILAAPVDDTGPMFDADAS